MYRRYTGYPGGLREEEYVKLLNRKPEVIVQQAILGMLPKSKLGRAMGNKLKVYRGDKHPHQAQQPSQLRNSGPCCARTGHPVDGHPISLKVKNGRSG